MAKTTENIKRVQSRVEVAVFNMGDKDKPCITFSIHGGIFPGDTVPEEQILKAAKEVIASLKKAESDGLMDAMEYLDKKAEATGVRLAQAMKEHNEPKEELQKGSAGRDGDISNYPDLASAVVGIVVEDIKRNGRIALALKNS
jgi:hypothetical protein